MIFLPDLIIASISLSLFNCQELNYDPEKLTNIINIIYGKPPDFTPTSFLPNLTNREIIDNENTCECIAYYLCTNGTACTDGCGVIDIRIRDDGCDNYLTPCCKSEYKRSKPVTMNRHPLVNKTTRGCGLRNPNGIGFRIIGNIENESEYGEFPWMVAVLRENDTPNAFSYYCGGSIIHPMVILTSAHCVNLKRKKYQIRAGEWDTQTTVELLPYQERTVVDIIAHPEYNRGSLYNDIALLILDEPLDFGEHIDTICLPSQDEIVENTRCYASGWGKNVFEKEGKYQAILKKVNLPIIPRDQCQELIRKTPNKKDFILHESFTCAGGEEGKDTCKGDGGSPLVCPIATNPKQYFQGGIVSWGIRCGDANVPGIYANVAKFRKWIDDHMIRLGHDTSYYTYTPPAA